MRTFGTARCSLVSSPLAQKHVLTAHKAAGSFDTEAPDKAIAITKVSMSGDLTLGGSVQCAPPSHFYRPHWILLTHASSLDEIYNSCGALNVVHTAAVGHYMAAYIAQSKFSKGALLNALLHVC